MYIVNIDLEKCEACGDCIDSCPIGGFDLVEENGKKYAVFNSGPDDCIGCMACEAFCEQGAITITEL